MNISLRKQCSALGAAITLCLSVFGFLPTAAMEDTFIDGFPDIPRLPIVSSVEGDAVVFDTASGTVAEVGLRLSVPPAQAFTSYSKALQGLGWTCRTGRTLLRCNRSDAVVFLTAPTDTDKNTPFILRLEPLS